MTIGSALFLAIGVAWIISFWNGSMGFSFAQPVAGSKFAMDITVTGWPALAGVVLTVIGAIMLIVSAVMAVYDLSTAGRVSARSMV